MSDARAVEARRQHEAARRAEAKAAQHREQRDRLVRALRAEDSKAWSYGKIARAVGCSPELVALIIRQSP